VIENENVDSEPMIEDAKLSLIKQEIRDGLSRVPGAGERLADIWTNLEHSINVNDMILHNMKTNQMHIHDLKMKHLARKALHEEKTSKLIEELPESLEKLEAELERIDSEERRDYKFMCDLMKASTAFAKEFRQCAGQQKSSVSMDKVHEMQLMFVAIIHTHVHDQKVLDDIADAIRAATLSLFPVSADKDI